MKRISVMSLLVLGLMILLLHSLCGCDAQQGEGNVLKAFKENIEDPNDATANWDLSLVNPSTYWHVMCNENNSLTRINLGRQSLSGQLVADLGQLKNLQHILLNDNNISGPIPPEMGDLTSLLDLNLYNNILNGSIPDSFGNLSKLLFLRLQGNKLTGSIPTSLSKLSTLLVLDLSNNKLSGTIPAGLFDLPKLRYLNLSNNNLKGKVPKALAKTRLIVDLRNNKDLSGPCTAKACQN